MVTERVDGPAASAGRNPDWLILGAPKAGTTALASWLAKHPGAYVPRKEISYFDTEYERGSGWYKAQFAGARLDQKAGEATPVYLYGERVVSRIARDCPAARLIVVLREPISRAWSNYWYLRTMGLELRTFAQAVADERAHQALPPWLPAGYLEMGHYARWLEQLARLHPDQQPIVLFSDDLLHNPRETFAAVCRHLNIAEEPPAADEPRPNAARSPRSARLAHLLNFTALGRAAGPLRRPLLRWNTVPGSPQMGRDQSSQLQEMCRDWNAELESLLGRPCPPRWSVESGA